MALIHILSFTILLTLIIQCALSIDSPDASPTPLPAGSSPLPSETESPSIPSPQSEFYSDFTPPLSDLAPALFSTPSPAPSLADLKSPAPSSVNLRFPEIASTPSPAPNDAPQASVPARAENEIPYVDAGDSKSKSSSSSGGRKAGIAIGVIVGACVVGVGGKVYKKRRDNIRRSRYRYTSREDFL